MRARAQRCALDLRPVVEYSSSMLLRDPDGAPRALCAAASPSLGAIGAPCAARGDLRDDHPHARPGDRADGRRWRRRRSRLSGWDRHGPALVLLGARRPGRSPARRCGGVRPAAAAWPASGLAALLRRAGRRPARPHRRRRPRQALRGLGRRAAASAATAESAGAVALLVAGGAAAGRWAPARARRCASRRRRRARRA